MESESVKWSLAYPLFSTKHHLELNGKPGVYRIRVFPEQEEPLPIHRLGGIDHAGILHPDHNPVVSVVDPDEGHPGMVKHVCCQVVMPALEL